MNKNNDTEWKLEEMEVTVEDEGKAKDPETQDTKAKYTDETLTIDDT